mmetsp:Transcript_44651/g.142314  ORF Transcript_44651/g.142314 Transcript_44651/m.142314 type:complete len:278 (+) Transcript_44651:1091-1924(+)
MRGGARQRQVGTSDHADAGLREPTLPGPACRDLQPCLSRGGRSGTRPHRSGRSGSDLPEGPSHRQGRVRGAGHRHPGRGGRGGGALPGGLAPDGPGQVVPGAPEVHGRRARGVVGRRAWHPVSPGRGQRRPDLRGGLLRRRPPLRARRRLLPRRHRGASGAASRGPCALRRMAGRAARALRAEAARGRQDDHAAAEVVAGAARVDRGRCAPQRRHPGARGGARSGGGKALGPVRCRGGRDVPPGALRRAAHHLAGRPPLLRRGGCPGVADVPAAAAA